MSTQTFTLKCFINRSIFLVTLFLDDTSDFLSKSNRNVALHVLAFLAGIR